jgi:signal transduction histidine kinase
MKTIFSRLILSFLLVTLVAIFSIGVFFTGLLKTNLTKQKETELINKGNQIIEVSKSFLNGDIDEVTFSFLLNSIDNIVDSRTLIINRSRIILNTPPSDYKAHGTHPPSKGNKLDDKDFEQIFNGKILVKTGYNPYFDETMITVGIPLYSVKNSSVVNGAIIMNSPVTGIAAATNKTILILAVAGLGALLLCLVAAYYLSKSLSKPIQAISGAAIEMADGDYSKKLDIHRSDEIGSLAYAFNYLTEKLNITINALNNEKSKLSDILQSMEEGLIAVDRDLNIIHVNPAALKLLNKSKQTKYVFNAIIENDDAVKNTANVLLNGKSSSLEWHIMENQILNLVISPLKYETEEVYGAIILIQDISESHKLEKMRRDFLANVSHELRTPLTSIRGFIEPLTDGTEIDSKTSLKYREIIKEETIRLEKIINAILDLSRLQSGKIILDIQKIDIIDLISNIIDKFKPLTSDKSINIEFVKPSNSIFVSADGDRLVQLMIIFIDNAIKYTNSGGLIKVILKEENEIVRVAVQDNGIGISAKDLPYIWERFYKVDKSRTNKYSGTGLGLSIAKNIIELHGQSVEVKSSPGLGSTFEFTIKKCIPGE